jgi:hypothetical protein
MRSKELLFVLVAATAMFASGCGDKQARSTEPLSTPAVAADAGATATTVPTDPPANAVDASVRGDAEQPGPGWWCFSAREKLSGAGGPFCVRQEAMCESLVKDYERDPNMRTTPCAHEPAIWCFSYLQNGDQREQCDPREDECDHQARSTRDQDGTSSVSSCTLTT